ncbi:uncharacterized protein LOC123526376 [Mercenaria mercenaria]|uniref:uncharacterized protein LOC123526376 n=1 Tax=Mercenaria mercenaria TaxID=6596 RepID=UPI00234FA815|nr:uncharacterized protein LOC123526376 [Mercenaria mercenaria]
MEKSKKLRLKRKVPQQKRPVATEVLGQNPNEAETVTLSSDSECDDGQSSKRRKIEYQQTDSEELQEGKREFLHTKNPSLNKLREMILSLSPRDVDITNLSPFPAFNTQVQETEGRLKNKVSIVKGRLQAVAEFQSGKMLSPFPKLCRHFRKSSKQIQKGLSTEISAEESGTDTETSKSVDIHDKHEQGSLNSSKFNNRELKHVSHFTKVDTGSEIGVRQRHIGEYRDENSSIIRDRNSNYYALQSQNTDGRRERKKLEPAKSNSTSDKLGTLKRVSQRKSEKEEAGEFVKSGNILVNKHDSRLDKELTTGIQKTHSIGGENKRNETKNGDRHTSLQDKFTTRLPRVNSTLDKNIREESNVSIMLQKNCTTSIRSTHSTKGDQNMGEVSPDRVVLENTFTAGIPRRNSSKAGEDVREGNKESATLQSCPLCQMKFDSRIGQIELDSHIAACLSTSEDDVLW